MTQIYTIRVKVAAETPADAHRKLVEFTNRLIDQGCADEGITLQSFKQAD